MITFITKHLYCAYILQIPSNSGSHERCNFVGDPNYIAVTIMDCLFVYPYRVDVRTAKRANLAR